MLLLGEQDVAFDRPVPHKYDFKVADHAHTHTSLIPQKVSFFAFAVMICMRAEARHMKDFKSAKDKSDAKRAQREREPGNEGRNKFTQQTLAL